MNGLCFIKKVMQGGKSFRLGLNPFLQKGLLLLLILPVLPEFKLMAQATFPYKDGARPFSFEEIPVRVVVDGYLFFNIDAIIGNNKLLFVNVDDLFNTLNIKCIENLNGNSLDGFIDSESLTYHVDFANRQIKMGSKIIMAQDRILKESGELYLETSLFSKAFGIDLKFNYRALTIILKADFELPIIKQKRIDKLRANISKIKGEVIADTAVKRDYHLLKLGTADWLVGSSQPANELAVYYLRFDIGAELLYGAADIVVNYDSRNKFVDRPINYIWRWADNDKPYIKQAQVGKINIQPISFINAPIIGAVVRNTPTAVRKAKGYYAINEFTEPNWSVELYINNVMVGYAKADASGQYSFKVPIVYGYTTLKLKSYGPLGEERTVERTMNVPYTVMPAKEFEYGLSVGLVQDCLTSRFARAGFNYGASRFLTIGGGLEYLSSIFKSPFVPFVTATLQPFSKLTLNGEFDYGLKASGTVSYYLRKDILLGINYVKYVEGQRITFYKPSEEQKVNLSVPLRYKKINGSVRMEYAQLVYKESNYNQGNLTYSSLVGR